MTKHFNMINHSSPNLLTVELFFYFFGSCLSSRKSLYPDPNAWLAIAFKKGCIALSCQKVAHNDDY